MQFEPDGSYASTASAGFGGKFRMSFFRPSILLGDHTLIHFLKMVLQAMITPPRIGAGVCLIEFGEEFIEGSVFFRPNI